MLKKLNIRNKILLFLLLLVLSIYILVTSLFYVNALESTKKDALNKLETLADIQYQRLEVFISNNKEKLELLNNLLNVKEILINNKTTNSPIKDHMENVTNNIKDIENVFIFDAYDKLIYADKKNNISEYYKTTNLKSKKETIIMYTEDSKKPIDIIFLKTLFADKTKIGTIAIQIDIDSLNNHIKNFTRLGKSGEVLMAYKHENKMIFFTPLRFKNSPIVVNLDSNLAIPMNYALSKKDKTFDNALDYIGTPVIAISRYLDKLGFGIVVKMNADEVLSLNDELKMLIFKIVLGLFIVVLIASIAISNFITAPIRVQERLTQKAQEQKEEFETIFNYTQDGIVIIDFAFNILKYNPAFLNMLNCKKDELGKRTFLELITPEDKQNLESIINHAKTFGYYENIQMDCIKRSGEKITVNTGISLLPDKKRLLLVLKDTSVLKIMEDQAKLASMGEMIGNIAHQWRQPLSVITASASGFKLNYQYGKELSEEYIVEFTDKIVEQAKYLSKTIDDFKNFIKGDALFTNTSIKNVLKSSLSLTSATLSNNNIQLILSIEDDIEIQGNKNELQQALINIINNAKDALIENIKKDEDRFISISTKLASENSLELKITDNGGGISEDILHRVFEPYFTTKHQSIGTGLGLSMAYKIIKERHQQSIVAQNEESEFQGKKYIGATFKIVFINVKETQIPE